MPNTARFTPGANQDNTLRAVRQDYQNPVYAASIVLKQTTEYTLVNFQPLTGALALSSDITAPYIGDQLELIFNSTPGATITYGAGFSVTAATQIIAAAKKGSAKFIFDGATWVERARAVTV